MKQSVSIPEQCEVGGALGEVLLMGEAAVMLLQQDAYGASMGRVELLQLMSLQGQRLPALQQHTYTRMYTQTHTKSCTLAYLLLYVENHVTEV